MNRIAGAAALAVIALFHARYAAAEVPTGRWIKECGEDVFCRIYIEKKGASRFNFHFMTTSPTSTDSCEWIATMKPLDGDGLATSGRGPRFEARLKKNGMLVTSGTMPTKCGKRPSSDVFEPDDADGVGDL